MPRLLGEVVARPRRRAEVAARGLERSRAFSLDAFGEALMAVYREAVPSAAPSIPGWTWSYCWRRQVMDDCRLEVIGAPFGLSPQARALWRRLLRQPRVRWLGPLPYAEAMRRMRGWTLGLLPRNGAPGAQESCPLKVLEYFAAGVPCVTSHRGAAERYRDACLFAEGPQAFAEACRIGVETHGQLAARCRARAAAWTWDRRVKTISALVEGRERADGHRPEAGRVGKRMRKGRGEG